MNRASDLMNPVIEPPAKTRTGVSPKAGLGLFLQVSGNPLILFDMAGRHAHLMFSW